MFKNYLVIAIRHILRNKVHSIINIFGLALGFASCILIYLFVMNEFSFDTFHDKADTIYYISFEIDAGFPATPAALGPALADDFPEVISYLKTRNQSPVIRYKDKMYQERVLLTDPSFFSFFSFRLKTGTPETALSTPNSIVITDHAARKYFGNENPMGRTLTIKFFDEQSEFTVSGIAESPPYNSSITFNFVINSANRYIGIGRNFNDWDFVGFTTFVRLVSKEQAAGLPQRFPDFIKKYMPQYIRNSLTMQVLPLIKYHLSNQWGGVGFNPPSSLIYSYILMCIGLSILLIACFNFINLTLGISLVRLREIGSRKVFGASQPQIIQQFLGETLVLAILAFLLGIFLADLFLPTINSLTGNSIHASYLKNHQNIIFAITLVIATAILAGGYPALIFSRLNVIQIFKKNLLFGSKAILIRSFIFLQFIICILLIIVAIIMNNQRSLLLNKDLGFDKENIITIPIFSTLEKLNESELLVNSLRHELMKYGVFESISGSWGLPAFSFARTGNKTMTGEELNYNYTRTDYDFLRTYGIKLITGRDFSPDIASDIYDAVIVNEEFLRRFSVPDPIGKRLADIFDEIIPFPEGSNGNWNDISKNKTIIGVTENFHTSSLRYSIEPAYIDLDPKEPYRYITIRIRGHRFQEAVEIIRENFQKLSPDQPFRYSFLEDDIENLYREEKRWNSIFFYSSLFAIFLSCLGLFGLTLLATSKRTKEIGIRKVNGASTRGVVFMLLREFIFIVIIANFIAWPIAYYFMNRWLENFAYHIDMGILPFLLAGFIALITALVTVSFQAIKAARANPVEALRYE